MTALLLICLLFPGFALPQVSQQGESAPTHTADSRVAAAKADCQKLLNSVVPFAQQMLRQHHGFYPLGAAMTTAGEVTAVAGWTGKERPDANQVIAVLQAAFQKGAASGTYRATALIVDVRATPPGKSREQDAIAVRLDHRDDYSIKVVYPYSFDKDGSLVIEPPFAMAGDKLIFDHAAPR